MSFILKILKNPLLAGSAALLIGNMVANVGSYAYHFLMLRMLSPVEYGSLAALIALVYIFAVFAATLNTTVVKFVTKYKAEKNYGKILFLLHSLTKTFFILGIFVFLIFIIGQWKIAEFLNLSNPLLVVLASTLLPLSLLSMINEGVIRSFLKFNFLAFNLTFAAIIKVGLAVLFVLLGFSVAGALGAIVLATILPYLTSFWPLKFLTKSKDKKAKIEWKELSLYGSPVLFATLGLTSLYTTDIILVKHFFSPFEAGLYSSLSLMGRMIFFASSAVTLAMFPLVSERFEKGDDYRGLLMQAFLLVAVSSVIITLIYFFFPQSMIQILSGNSSYLVGSSLLGLFGIFITLYSLSSVVVNFCLSIRKVKVAVVPFLAAIVQTVLIWFFHSSLLQIIQLSIFVSTLLLGSLLVYSLKDAKKARKEKASLGYSSGL